MSSTGGGLDRGSLTSWGMTFFTVGASAPMTVLAGAVVATYAVTGSTGVPLSFLVLMVVLVPFTVGYTAISRHISTAGPFYAVIAKGLGRAAGVAGGLMALLAYNAIQICLYGLLGASMASFWPGAGLAWWAWALLAWGVVGLLGILHISLNAKVLGVMLVAEIIVIGLFDLAGFTHPAGGHVSLAGLAPGNLFASGLGGVLAFGVACFVGYESGMAYSEESRGVTPVVRGTFNALLFLGVFYALSSLAVSVTYGPTKVVDAARDPGTGIPFSLLQHTYGGAVAWLANVLLITSIMAAMISFHNTVARYLFAMGRNRVLPGVLATTGSGRSAASPVSASLLQSGLALVVFAGFAIAGADPVATLFTWLSAVAALAIVILMAATSIAIVRWFRAHPEPARREGGWATTGAPIIGALLLLGVWLVTVTNIGSILATNSPIQKAALPLLVVATAVVGLVWGNSLRMGKPLVYQSIGDGDDFPLDKPTPAFADVPL